MKRPCIVVYNDDDMISNCPYGWDADCPGALEASDKPVLFPDHAAARKAIRISKAFAKLRQEQGKIVNTDFIDGIRHVIIRDVVVAEGGDA